ncbi:MAG TPA: asparagine synthase (glutamine-hydrolyzing) [Thiolapillus brandeum]|uniref:asparagine synthase (glutamine-hydrolyzing) n=1 Tax=Thiolapillus brandeum TaxID=1076588 RepID=A0A831RWT6_9GAMM|nr:asparagine synthase (glutamine-hydrolyzing) [Thiolapillus brandeum]
MCGLAFLFNQKIPVENSRNRVSAALEKILHRGPDDGRMETAGDATIGHRRLSIIDLEGSPQPMQDSTGRYLLAYNGEIYNYREIRATLVSRWSFATEGDTEVLLAGLILEGENFLERLEGMWAFALWDSCEQRLLLGRDRMGKKPLFYQLLENGRGIACASEIPALRELSDVPWHEDERSVFDYLNHGYAMPGYTALREVREILPGHVAEWRMDGEFSQRSWWKLQIRDYHGKRTDAAIELRQAFTDAVEKRMVADVEVGAFLSGGIDSSLVCAIICKELGHPVKTFTIGFEEEAFDERQYARQVSELYGTDHYEEILTSWDENILEHQLLHHVGQPFADASILPTALVSKVAARHVKVALSGDGGDELFSGYQRYQARNILIWYSRLPKGLQHLAEKAVRALPEPVAHHSRSILKKAHLFMDIVERQQAETPYFAPLMFSPTLLQHIAPELKKQGNPPPGIPEQTELDDIGRMMFADALVYLPQDVLTKVDRASMAHSLETRAPLLDRKVVELAFSLPRHWHRGYLGGKKMLRTAFSDLLPSSIWTRRKQGFGVPIHAWFRGKLGDRLLTLAQENADGPLSTTAVSELLEAHRHGGRDHGYRLWVLYSYLLWRSNRA